MRSYLAVVIALACACGNKSAKEKEDEDPALSFIADGVRDSVAKIKESIAAGKPDDGYFKCAHMANIAEIEKSKPHEALAAEYRKLCETELPVAVITKHVVAAEEARKAKPDDKTLSECFNARLTVAYDDLKAKDSVKELVSRFEAACPGQKIGSK